MGEALGLGSAFISERFNIKEAVDALGRGRRGVVDARHRDRRHEPQHAPPDRHRVVRHDDAPAHRRPVHARPRPRHRPAVRRVRHPADHDRADRGLRRPHAPALEGRGGPRPRRPGREVPRPAPRRVVRRGHPARLRRVRPELARARRPRASTWSCCTRSSPTRRSSAASRRSARAAEEAGRDPASVRIWSCYATIGDHLPEALRLKKTVGRLATYLQGYGDLLVETNGWDPAVLAALPRRRASCRRFPARIDTKADTATLEHVATLLPDEWLEPAATGDARAVRGAGAAPVRPRRRRRDHARRHARPSSTPSSTRTGRSAPPVVSTLGPPTPDAARLTSVQRTDS